MPTISVVIPTHNRAAMLREAIASVQAQTFTDWELIVVDDGSTDETPAVMQRYVDQHPRIHYCRQPNQGDGGARNAGIAVARGRYVGFLDDDDAYLPTCLERQLACLDADPGLGFVYTRMRVRHPDGRLEGLKPAKAWPDTWEALVRNSFIPMDALVRRECFTLCGMFDVSLARAPDYDMWLRIACRFPFASTEEPLAIVRWHAGNKSASIDRVHYDSHIKIFGKLLANPMVPPRDRPAIREQLARNWYLYGKACYRDGLVGEACRSVWQSVRLSPGVGSTFVEPTDSLAQRLWKTLKPYAAIGHTWLAGLRGA